MLRQSFDWLFDLSVVEYVNVNIDGWAVRTCVRIYLGGSVCPSKALAGSDLPLPRVKPVRPYRVPCSLSHGDLTDLANLPGSILTNRTCVRVAGQAKTLPK